MLAFCDRHLRLHSGKTLFINLFGCILITLYIFINTFDGLDGLQIQKLLLRLGYNYSPTFEVPETPESGSRPVSAISALRLSPLNYVRFSNLNY